MGGPILVLIADGTSTGKLFDLGFFRPCFLLGAVMLTASQLGLSFANSFATLFIAQGESFGLLIRCAPDLDGLYSSSTFILG
jgi:hypothetical protein